MAIDHSSLAEPSAIRREATGSATADRAVLVTPPPWAVSVDLRAADGDVKVATVGTAGSALTHYFTVPATDAYNLPLQSALQAQNAVQYYVSTAVTTHLVEYSYIPRGK